MTVTPATHRPWPVNPVEPYEIDIRVMPALAVVETFHSLDQARGEACVACGARTAESEPDLLDELVVVGRERRHGTAVTAHRECMQSWLARWFRDDDPLEQAQLAYYRLREQIAAELHMHLEERGRMYEIADSDQPSRELRECESTTLEEAALVVRFGTPDGD